MGLHIRIWFIRGHGWFSRSQCIDQISMWSLNANYITSQITSALYMSARGCFTGREQQVSMSKKPFRDKNIKMVTPEMSSSASESFCPSHFLSLTFQFALFVCSPPNSSTSFCRYIIFLTPYFYSVPHTGRMFLVAHCPHTYIISPSLTENYVFNLFSKRFLVVDADFEAKSRRSRKVTFIN